MRESDKRALGALLLLGGGLFAATMLNRQRARRDLSDDHGRDDGHDREHDTTAGGISIRNNDLFIDSPEISVGVVKCKKDFGKIILSIPTLDLRFFQHNVNLRWRLRQDTVAEDWRFDLHSLPGLGGASFANLTVHDDGKAISVLNQNSDRRVHRYNVNLVHPETGRRLSRDPSVRNGPIS